MVTRVDVDPDVLMWAVDRAGWTDETAERRAPKLDQWIAGMKPTLKQIEKFAHDTHTPLGMLFLAEPPEERIPIPDMRTVGNARVGRPSGDLLDTIYICQQRQDWYRSFALEHGLAAADFVGSATTDTRHEIVADQIRQMLGFELTDRSSFSGWDDALRQLIDRIEAVGVLVMVNGVVGSNTHRRLNPEEFRGFALADQYAPLIFVNGADTKAAQIFTLIHELGHVWLGESALSDAAMTARSGQEAELWCNRVAAEVLVPLAAVRRDFGAVATAEELQRLARVYRVSTLVVLKRLFDASFLTWDEYQERYAQERERVMALLEERRKAGSGGNYYFTQPLRLSRQFTRAVVSSAYEGTTSFRDAFKLLGTKRHQTFQNLAEEVGIS